MATLLEATASAYVSCEDAHLQASSHTRGFAILRPYMRDILYRHRMLQARQYSRNPPVLPVVSGFTSWGRSLPRKRQCRVQGPHDGQSPIWRAETISNSRSPVGLFDCRSPGSIDQSHRSSWIKLEDTSMGRLQDASHIRTSRRGASSQDVQVTSARGYAVHLKRSLSLPGRHSPITNHRHHVNGETSTA